MIQIDYCNIFQLGRNRQLVSLRIEISLENHQLIKLYRQLIFPEICQIIRHLSGNNAWVGIALAQFAAETGESCYLVPWLQQVEVLSMCRFLG